MNEIILFAGSIIMILTGFKFNIKSNLSVGLGLMWMAVASIV